MTQKKYYVLILSIFLAGCSPKIVDKIVFKNIDIPNIEIASGFIPDSIIIDNIDITGSGYYYSEKDKSIFVNNYFMDSIVFSNANGDSIVYDPIINTFIVDKVFLRDKKYKLETSYVSVISYDIHSMFINKDIATYDRNPAILAKLKSLYEEVKEKQDSAMNIIINQIKLDPNHASREIQNSKFYKDIQIKMDNILQYIQSDIHSVLISEKNINELYNIDRLLDLIIQEVNSIESMPHEFSNELFFELGEYQIKKNNIEEAEKLIADIMNKVSNGTILYANIAISGYSDDVVFSNDLENELKLLYLNIPFPNDAIEKRKLLNKLLSEKRAESLANYIKRRVKIKDLHVDINFDSKGFGEEYPPSLKSSGVVCDGDCKERRIAFVSIFVIKQE